MLELQATPLRGQPYFDPERAWLPPMNFDPAFRGQLTIERQLYVYDVTLRDGEQTPGVAFPLDVRLRLAEELDAIGVESIEAGIPVVAKDFEAMKLLARRPMRAKICALVRATESDIDAAVEAGVKMVIVEHSVNPYTCKLAYGLDEAGLVEKNVQAVRYAKSKGLLVNWMGWDGFRQRLDYIQRVFVAVVEAAGPDRVTIADTFGMTHPLAVNAFFRRFRQWFPDKLLEYHVHNDYGLAAGNALAALTGGANAVHTAVNGLGERAGNVALEEVVLACQVAMGLDLGIDTTRLARLCRLGEQFSGKRLADNKPVAGEHLFKVDSGLIIHIFTEAEKAGFPRLVMLPYQPGLVGRDDFRYVYGKGAGMAAVRHFLDRLGIAATDEQAKEILARLKAECELRRSYLGESEFLFLVKQVTG